MFNTIFEKNRKSSKNHTCDYCLCAIKKGIIYKSETLVGDGNICIWKSHLECSDLVRKLSMMDYADEGIDNELFDFCIDEKFNEFFPEESPEHESWNNLYDKVLVIHKKHLKYTR